MKDRVLNVKVVGRGCDKYFELLTVVRNVLGAGNRIEEVNNSKEIAQLGIRQMPALIINDKIILQGTNFERNTLVNVLARENKKKLYRMV